MAFSTNTTTAGMFRHRVLGGRNQHLLPEIHARAKRMLLQAQQEHINANSSVVMQLCEVWKMKRTGPSCTCSKKTLEAQKEERQDSYLDLKHFLQNKELVPMRVAERCPLCLGSGFIGGYDLQGTQLMLLDATNVTKFKESNVIQERPWWIETPAKTSKVSWLLTIPKYISDVYGVSIIWKKQPKKFSLELNGDPVDMGLLLANAGKRVTISLRVKDGNTPDLGVYGIFFHFVTGSTMVNVDLPNWTKNFSGGLKVWEEVQETVTANFDARVNNLTPADIFILKEGFIYRITEVDCNRPLEVNISWNCSANLVRPTQHYYILPSKLSLTKYPRENTSFVL